MTILIVQRLVGKEKLSHFAVDGTVDFEMNMWSAHIAAGGRIRAGLDGCERVTTVAVSTQHGIALEVGIDRQLSVRVRWVSVPPICVCLPKLDTGVPHWLATQIQDAAAELNHLPGSSLSVTVNQSQVAIGLSWFYLWVERTVIRSAVSR